MRFHCTAVVYDYHRLDVALQAPWISVGASTTSSRREFHVSTNQRGRHLLG